jgi:hypothetical protein
MIYFLKLQFNTKLSYDFKTWKNQTSVTLDMVCVIVTTPHKIQEQEHEICTTNMKMDLYYDNVCKHEYEKNLKKLCCRIVPKTGVE